MSGRGYKAYFRDIGYWIEAELGKRNSSLESRFMQVGLHAFHWPERLALQMPCSAQIDG